MNEVIAMMWVAMILFVAFETSAVYEYSRLLLPNFISKMKEYKHELEFNPQMSYGSYFRIYHDSFLVRWATCPYCFGMALSVASSLVFSNWKTIPITYIGSLLIYRLFTRADKWLYGGLDE
jgi:uncharacterized membrane protein